MIFSCVTVTELSSFKVSTSNHSHFRKRHDFVPDFSRAERRTRIVIGITTAMMIVEIVVGLMSHSMALLADGWHMSTHVIAFLIAAVAYYLARSHAGNVQFSFGTGKIGVLGGFTSAVILSIVAFLMAAESVRRLFAPLTIHFNEAIGIASIGLLVNLSCALLLSDGHHESGHGDAHDHDLNLRAAYLHVLADAFTSVLAISALTGGKFFGWAWLDPVVGIVGSGVVFSWAYTLLRDTSGILLDRTPASSDLPDEIRRAVESDGDSLVTDLHVWQVGIGKYAAIVSIVAHEPKSCESYRTLLHGHDELVHVTIETQLCREDHESIGSP
jgi:cation diffusion facilitator family transporter